MRDGDVSLECTKDQAAPCTVMRSRRISDGGSKPSCRRRRPDRRRSWVTDSSSTWFSTAPKRAALGVTCPSASGRGSRCTTGSPTGRRRGTETSYSASYSSKATTSEPSSTAPSSALTKMRRAEEGGPKNCLGHSRGGFSTKLHSVVDTQGGPLHVALTQGHRHEMIAADVLLAHARGKALIGNTGYDSNRFIQAVRDRGMKPVIHSKPERKVKHRLGRRLSRQRYRV
jgi:hypothetical protein